MPSSGYRKTTADFGQMSKDLQSAAASFGRMTTSAGLFINMVQTFAEFENKIIRVNALAGGTAKNLQELSDAARDIAITTKYGAAEAAEAMTLLAQAGFSTKETIEAIPEVLKLAQASMEDINIVSDMVASTIRTFNLDVEETSRVVNVFAAANAKSLASVNKLAFSMRQVGPVASEFGLSLEETTGALSVLYNRGLRGEQAGTALRNIIVRLIKPTKELSEVFDSLGLAMRDEKGAYSLQQLLGQLRGSGITDEQLTKMFGREALAGAKTLIAATGGEWDEMTKKITGTNEATRQAQEQLGSLTNQLNLAKNALNELWIGMGSTLAPSIKAFTEQVTSLAQWFRQLDDDSKESINNFLKWTAVLLGAKAGISGFVSLLSRLNHSWLSTTSSIKAFSTKLVEVKNFFGNNKLRGELKAYATELIRLNEIASAKGTDWYVRVNEEYKRLHNGKNLYFKQAEAIKNLTDAEIEWLKVTSAADTAWGALTKRIKAFVAAYAPLAAIIAGAALASKDLIHIFAGSRELSDAEKDKMFPEMVALREQIEKTNKIVTEDLPSIVSKIKAAQKDIRDTFKAQENLGSSPFAELQNVTGDWGAWKASSSEATLRRLLTVMLEKGVPTTEEVARALAKAGLPKSLANGLREALLKADKEHSKDWFYRYTRTAEAAISEVLESQYDAFIQVQRELEAQLKESTEAIKRVFSESIKSYDDIKKLFFKDPEKASDFEADQAMRAFIYKLTGIDIPPMRDVIKYVEEHKNLKTAIIDALQSPENIQSALDFVSAGAEGRYNINVDAIVSMKVDKQAEQEAKEAIAKQVQASAALVAQESTVKNLRAAYSELINEYKKRWQLVNQEVYSDLNKKTLDLQIDKLKTANYNAQVQLLKKIFEESKQLDGLQSTITQEYLNQSGIISEIGAKEIQRLVTNSDIEQAQKDMVLSLLEQIKLNGLIVDQKVKDKEKEKDLFDLVEGRLKNLKKYKEALDDLIDRLDKAATIEPTWENFAMGAGAGLLTLEKDIDSFYDMGKKGMVGFANFMTDSMNNVVDAWGKGWGAMRDALKNTLVDMLKDLSHYFMKQAMYGLITQAGGNFFGGNIAGYFANNYWAGHAATEMGPFLNAKGSAWDKGMQTFANGGVVTSPTLFNHRGGKGLMGEAGPEAIMPLRRDSQGRLGVSVAGGSTLNYAPSFNINMTTGQMDTETSQRNTNRMTKELDSKVKNAVLLVLAKEKRPGGLLYGR